MAKTIVGTRRIRFIGTPVITYEEVKIPADKRFAKLKKEFLTEGELKPDDWKFYSDYMARGGPPVAARPSRKKSLAQDKDGNIIRRFPKGPNGKPVRKSVLNKYWAEPPEYTIEPSLSDCEKLIGARIMGESAYEYVEEESTGNADFTAVMEMLKESQDQTAALGKELAALKAKK